MRWAGVPPSPLPVKNTANIRYIRTNWRRFEETRMWQAVRLTKTGRSRISRANCPDDPVRPGRLIWAGMARFGPNQHSGLISDIRQLARSAENDLKRLINPANWCAKRRHGFRARLATTGGRKVLAARRARAASA